MRLIDTDKLKKRVKNFAYKQIELEDYEIDKYVEILRIIDKEPSIGRF